MKKLLCAAAAALFAVSAVVAEKPAMYLDGGITVPVLSNLDSEFDSEITTSVGIEASFRTMFTKIIGVYANAGAVFPQEMKIENDSTTHTFSRSDMNDPYGFTFLLGLAIAPVNTKKLTLTIAPGLAFNTFHSEIEEGDKKATYDTTMFGLGCNAGLDINLTKSLYIKPAVEMDYYFHEWNKTEVKLSGHSSDNTEDDSCSYLMIKPGLSFGFRF